MKMRRVVGFANKDSPSPEGFNELTIKVLTEETQEYCGCWRLLLTLPSLGTKKSRSFASLRMTCHSERSEESAFGCGFAAPFIFTVSRTALSSA
jgi:hypothetical protein